MILLKELQNLIEMPLKINQQPSSGLDVSKIDYKSERQVTEVDNTPIFQYNFIGSNASMFGIKHEGNLVAYIVGEIENRQFYVRRTWTDSAFRGKGYATALYRALFVNLHYILISDKELSPESRSIWKKLNKIFNNRVKIYDASNGEIFDFTDDENSKYYQDEKYLFVLESTQMHLDFKSLPNVLKPYVYYLNEGAIEYWQSQGIELL